jgi:hypothetical protein
VRVRTWKRNRKKEKKEIKNEMMGRRLETDYEDMCGPGHGKERKKRKSRKE